MSPWRLGGLLDELKSTGSPVRNRERLSAALSHLVDDGLVQVEGESLDNTRFGPTAKGLK
jgi:hypothetical protein